VEERGKQILGEDSGYHGPERRNGVGYGWTLWREIYGTVIGIMPFVAALLVWGSSINERVRVAETEIQHLKETDIRHEQSLTVNRSEELAALNNITVQLTQLQQQVARLQGNTEKH
jgi:hypothetical protein